MQYTHTIRCRSCAQAFQKDIGASRPISIALTWAMNAAHYTIRTLQMIEQDDEELLSLLKAVIWRELRSRFTMRKLKEALVTLALHGVMDSICH